MAKPVRVPAGLLFDTAAVARGRHVVAVAAGPRNDVAVLSLNAPLDYRRSDPGGAGFPKRHADRPNSYQIDHYQAGEWASVTLPATRENFHHLQPLAGGWLLVRGRAAGDADRNAHLYGPDGTPVGAFHAGDGIAHVQVTEADRVWVGYFDEGVFGDTALGRAGLACLDTSGRVNLRFNDLAAGGAVPDIADCYAMNVASDREVWVYYYTEFPLVRLVDGRVADVHRRPGVTGGHAVAVSGRHALFAGGYSHRSRLTLADLTTGRVREVIPAIPTGRRLGSFSAIGRGGRLYLLTGAEVYAINMDDLTG